ncbi:aminotransferase class IV [Pseudooceanicola sp. CBS1P-1]|uniref:Probable branched-chain-amino-acid aminotransferase n=1 Tax=Pseudooceanicola albus TaxID=2692189 RepID=A0A6L7G499_9RHOB|nr:MULTISPECIES: aminotransferase class IV [Pseudooceanicola]MBT9385196.1 aminotransferase class IV [Pseudooceanicola endophyticus]MXN18512.1 branched chain amino acid aminotransferase [Pseudooceanicola albus]
MEKQTYFRGVWGGAREVSLPIGLHGLWNACSVFDGARAISGRVPDLLEHCQRLVDAAPSMLMQSPLSAERIAALALEGIARFPDTAELYITPLLFSTGEGLIPDAGATEFMLSVAEAPLPRRGLEVCTGIGITRPAPGTMQTAYKASWLYANAVPARRAAQQRGFDDAVMLAPSGQVVEFSTANLWLVRDGRLVTPPDAGSILPGITRARVLDLLRAAGLPVEEAPLYPADLEAASELFSTGNSGQIRPVTRLDARDMAPGPVYRQVHRIYWDWLQTQTVAALQARLAARA